MIKAQIPSIGYVWTKLPDRPPADNTVLLPLINGKVMGGPEGKLEVLYTIRATHIFRRAEQYDTLTRAYMYIQPWLLMLSAWQNQTLGGLARDMTPTDVKVVQMNESGQPVIALTVDFNVLVEFNVVTN